MLLMKVGFIIAFPLLLLGAVVLKDGMVVVDFKDRTDNSRVFVPVPLSFVNLGLKMLPNEKLHEANLKLAGCEQYLQAASDHLMELPDVKFVEVKTPREKFELQKRGSHLVLDLDTEDQQVHISVPIRGMKKVAQNLAEIAQ